MLSLQIRRCCHTLLLTGLCLLPSACGRYQFFVNEQLVYSPPPLFSDFATQDLKLQDCLQQTIVDQQITEAQQLRQLNCSHAGIQSLLGVEVFTGLKAVNLSDNAIETLDSLASLQTLETLHLANNRVQDVSALAGLKNLKSLKLTGNDRLACETLSALPSGQALTIDKPAHCTRAEDNSQATAD